jgi:hypothetical protein
MARSSYEKENRLWLFMTTEEQREYYNEVLDRVIANPRKYLDNLEYLDVFRVAFINYTSSDNRSLRNRKLYK